MMKLSSVLTLIFLLALVSCRRINHNYIFNFVDNIPQETQRNTETFFDKDSEGVDDDNVSSKIIAQTKNVTSTVVNAVGSGVDSAKNVASSATTSVSVGVGKIGDSGKEAASVATGTVKKSV
jgi:hypothetical protein